MRRRALLAAAGGLAGVGVAGELFGDREFELTSVTVEGVPEQVAFDVEVLDGGVYVTDPASLRLAVTNRTDEPLTFYNRGVAPFGVPALTDPDGRGVTALRSPAYEESELVGDRDEVPMPRESVAREIWVQRTETAALTLDPGETRAERYTVRQFDTRTDPEYVELAGGVGPPGGAAPLLWFEPAGGDDIVEGDVTVRFGWRERPWPGL